MMSKHHPRCEHYTPPPADPRFARFGEAMWKYITKVGGDFCGEEISEDILPLAQAAGLCCYHEPGERATVIVLTVAHLDHNVSNNDDSNLVALCQRCHLTYDAKLHAINARKTREAKSGQMALL